MNGATKWVLGIVAAVIVMAIGACGGCIYGMNRDVACNTDAVARHEAAIAENRTDINEMKTNIALVAEWVKEQKEREVARARD